MKILGLDPASNTGWSLLDDGKLADFGVISVTPQMTLPQKLNFVSTQIQSLLNRLNPDLIAIEDTVMVSKSGVTVIKYLARIGAIYIFESYKKIQERVELYEPSTWKCQSLPGIIGNSPKWKIQLEVSRFFGKVTGARIDEFEKFISAEQALAQSKKQEMASNREKIDALKRDLQRKRDALAGDTRKNAEDNLKQAEKLQVQLKKELKEAEKKAEKNLSKICVDIYSLTGISSDIADATCIAYCRFKKL